MKNKKLIIIAKFLVKQNKHELVKKELLKLIEITRTEKGCINYDLHHDNDNKNCLFVLEKWENYELWQFHVNSKHLADSLNVIEDSLDEFTVNKMTEIV